MAPRLVLVRLGKGERRLPHARGQVIRRHSGQASASGGAAQRIRKPETSGKARESEEAVRRRRPALPAGRLTDTENARTDAPLRRLRSRSNYDAARKEGTRGGTRGSPT